MSTPGLDDEYLKPDEDLFSPQAVASSYDEFCRRITSLVDQLGFFSSECRQLGRSFSLIMATGDLREQLELFLLMFYNNATYLSPLVQEPKLYIGEHLTGINGLDAFPEQFEKVAECFEDVRERLDEFREYTDESLKIKALMHLFGKDLKYRAACLNAYKDQFNSIVIRRYVHTLTQEIGEDLDDINSALLSFNKYGLPAMQHEQKRSTNGALNLSTMATFFSAVTATTLQISVGYALSPIFSLVNTFWFCSLVLSIGAALNSLLAFVWKQTKFGTRGRGLPLWVTVWIHISAPMFLTLSIVCFSAGLILFTYATHQATYTSVLTITTTALTTFGLVTVSAWIGYEQWTTLVFLRNPPWASELRKGSRMAQRKSRIGSISDQSSISSSSDKSSLDILGRNSHMFRRSHISDFLSDKLRSFNAPDAGNQHVQFDHEKQAFSSIIAHKENQGIQNEDTHTTSTATRNSWPYTSHPVIPMSPLMQVGVSSVSLPVQMDTPKVSSEMSLSEEPISIKYEYGVIQDLEYSPDGQFLATTGFDQVTETSTTVNLSMTNPECIFHHQHANNRKSAQVVWSPNGHALLVRLLDHSVELLDSKCAHIVTIKRPRSIEVVAWCDASSFLSVERGTVHKLSLGGQSIAKYRFENLLVRDVAIVPNSDLLLVVGRVLFPGVEVLPRNSRGEKQFILYDMKTKEYKSRNPILDDTRYIKISNHISSTRNVFDILIGHKDGTPPRLWTLEPRPNNDYQLTQRNIYLQSPGELTGPGYFVGEQDQMVACTTTGMYGDIHVWDRESGVPLHHIPAQTMSTGPRNIACGLLQHTQPGVMISCARPNELDVWVLKPGRSCPPGFKSSDPPEPFHPSERSSPDTGNARTL